jgi:hypothetical protein
MKNTTTHFFGVEPNNLEAIQKRKMIPPENRLYIRENRKTCECPAVSGSDGSPRY